MSDKKSLSPHERILAILEADDDSASARENTVSGRRSFNSCEQAPYEVSISVRVRRLYRQGQE